MNRTPESIDTGGRLVLETGVAEDSPAEFHELELLRYRLAGDWQDRWSADLRLLAREFKALHIPVESILRLLSETVVEEKIKQMQALSDEELDVEGQRLLLTLELQNHRAERQRIEARQAACRQRMRFIENDSGPVLSMMSASLRRRLDAILEAAQLDYRLWGCDIQQEFKGLCSDHAEAIRKESAN